MNDEVLGGLELDMHEKAAPTHSPPVSAWRSFMSGCVSGMAAVVVGQVRDRPRVDTGTIGSSLWGFPHEPYASTSVNVCFYIAVESSVPSSSAAFSRMRRKR